MLRTLFAPKMLLSHLLVLVVAAGCVIAGQWQWQRLTEAREYNALAEQRMDAAPVAVEDLAGGELDPAELEHRRVHATGTFRPHEEVVQRNQGHQGSQGLHVLTPLELEDGTPVLVLRGSVPPDLSDPPLDGAPPPEGEVEITGWLQLSVPQPSFGASDPAEGRLERVFHADTERLNRQVEGELFPMVLRMQTPAPTDGDLPLVLGEPELDEANHLSYALQWFTFALLALGTYVVWLVRRLQRGAPAPPPAQAPADDRAAGPGVPV